MDTNTARADIVERLTASRTDLHTVSRPVLQFFLQRDLQKVSIIEIFTFSRTETYKLFLEQLLLLFI